LTSMPTWTQEGRFFLSRSGKSLIQCTKEWTSRYFKTRQHPTPWGPQKGSHSEFPILIHGAHPQLGRKWLLSYNPTFFLRWHYLGSSRRLSLPTFLHSGPEKGRCLTDWLLTQGPPPCPTHWSEWPPSIALLDPHTIYILGPWRWRQHIPLEHCYPAVRPHCLTTQMTISRDTPVNPSNLMFPISLIPKRRYNTLKKNCKKKNLLSESNITSKYAHDNQHWIQSCESNSLQYVLHMSSLLRNR
jgi:hypothetical protein